MKQLKGVLIFLSTLSIGVLLFIFLIRDTGLQNIIEGLSVIRGRWAATALFLFFSAFAVDAFRWKMILTNQGFESKFRHVVIAKFAGFALSYLTPVFYVGGEGVRAYVLKKSTGITAGDGIRTILIDKIIEGLMLSILLIFGGLLLISKFSAAFYIITAISMIVVGVLGLCLFFWQISNDKSVFRFVIKALRLYKIKYIKDKEEKIYKIENEVYLFFHHNKRLFFKTLILSVVSVMIYAILFKLILASLGYEISILTAILIKALVIIIGFIPVPGELGVYEGVLGYTFVILGFDAVVGVNFGLIMRAFYSLWVTIGLISLSRFGISLVRNMFNENEQV